MENTRIESRQGVARQAQKAKNLEQYFQEGVQFVRQQLYIIATTPDPIIDKHREAILYSLSIPDEVA